MAKSDALFQLIKSMNSNEKRNFQLSAISGSTSGHKQYLELFELLTKMETYDEAAIVRQLSNAVFAKNISAGKNYLYGLILKSLRQFYSGSSNKTAQITVAELWIDIQILLDKGLFQQGLKLIGKAKKICQQYHFNFDLLKINALERDLKNNFERKNTIMVMQQLQDEASQTLQTTVRDLDSFGVYETVFTHIKNKDEAAKVKVALEKGLTYFDLIPKNEEPLSIWTFVNYHNLMALHQEYRRNYEGYVHHLAKIIALFDQDEKLKIEYQDRYLNTLNNYFNGCLQAKQLEALPALLKKLKDIPPRNIRNQAKIEQHQHYYQLLYHLIKAQYGEVIQLAPAIKQCLEQYENFLSINRKLTFLYNVGVAFFLETLEPGKDKTQHQELLKQSLDWFNEIENEAKFETRKDVRKFTKTLTAIIYFELDEMLLLESKINMGIRYLKKVNSFNSGEGLVFKNLHKILHAKDKREQVQIFKNLYLDLAKFPGLEELRKWVATKFR